MFPVNCFRSYLSQIYTGKSPSYSLHNCLVLFRFERVLCSLENITFSQKKTWSSLCWLCFSDHTRTESKNCLLVGELEKRVVVPVFFSALLTSWLARGQVKHLDCQLKFEVKRDTEKALHCREFSLLFLFLYFGQIRWLIKTWITSRLASCCSRLTLLLNIQDRTQMRTRVEKCLPFHTPARGLYSHESAPLPKVSTLLSQCAPLVSEAVVRVELTDFGKLKPNWVEQ